MFLSFKSSTLETNFSSQTDECVYLPRRVSMCVGFVHVNCKGLLSLTRPQLHINLSTLAIYLLIVDSSQHSTHQHMRVSLKTNIQLYSFTSGTIEEFFFST